MMKIEHYIANVLPSMPGWCTAARAQAIYDAIGKLDKAVNGVEIGTLAGRSLMPAAMAARDHSKQPSIIVGIDPFDPAACVEFMTDAETIQWWTHKADLPRCKQLCQAMIASICSVSQWCKLRVAREHLIAGEFANLNYLAVDGNHERPAVLRGLDLYLPKVVSGGIIMLDNTGWPGVADEADRVRNISDLIEYHGDWEIWRKR